MPGTNRRRDHALVLLLVLATVHVLVNFAITPNTPFPFYPDDFSFLAAGVQDIGWHWKRPVSSNVIFLIAEFGPAFCYFALSAVTVVVAWMVLVLLRDVFSISVGIGAAALCGGLLFSQAAALEHSKFLGLMTNLVSHGLGLASLLLLWHGWRNGDASRCALSVLFYGLCVFAKEDFLLPPLVLIALLLALDRSARLGGRAAWASWRWPAAISLAFLTLAAGSLAWSAYDRNPFVAGLFSPASSNPAYAVELAPAILLDSMRTLFIGYAPAATVLAALACVLLWRMQAQWRPAVLWFVATVLVLAAPYAVIPHAMSGHRAYAWLPWAAAVVALAMQAVLERVRPPAAGWRRALVAAVALAIVGATWISQQEARDALVERYGRGETVNRRMLEALEAHRGVLADAPVVGLTGLGGTSPWCGNGPVYLSRKRGFTQRWVVFASGESACYRNPAPGGARPRLDLRMSVVPLQQACTMSALPILAFDPDGHGELRRGSDYCKAGP